MCARLRSAVQPFFGPLNFSFPSFFNCASFTLVPVLGRLSRLFYMPLFLQPSFDFLRPVLKYKTLVLEPMSHDQPSSVGLDHQLGQLIFKPFLPYIVWNSDSELDGKLDPHFVLWLHCIMTNRTKVDVFYFVCFLMGGRVFVLTVTWISYE